ncbi:MAG: ATP synthase F0 subunit B [Candidatus Pacebacteria bacterium]|nr:ATP synthase F0 subunit B [Candidatus Paceibacterota bacterium]MBP9851529.1 ATP synthase F0 subunit B [Candidatus Paceibacterota bacterium]
MEALISTFHIDWKLMVAQIINFAVVFAALYLLAAKPLKKLIQERTEEITTGLLSGKENQTLLENTKKEYEAVLLKARNEAHELLQETKIEANAKKAEMLEVAKSEVATIIENGKKTLEAEKTKMVNEAKNEVASLVIQATEKVLQEKSK